MKKTLLLLLIISNFALAKETLTQHLDACFQEKIPSKLFLYKVDQEIKKNKKILSEEGLDGSIARVLGAFTVPKENVLPGYDICLSFLYEYIKIENKAKHKSLFEQWTSCIPESESLKKETKKLKKCFKVE